MRTGFWRWSAMTNPEIAKKLDHACTPEPALAWRGDMVVGKINRVREQDQHGRYCAQAMNPGKELRYHRVAPSARWRGRHILTSFWISPLSPKSTTTCAHALVKIPFSNRYQCFSLIVCNEPVECDQCQQRIKTVVT